MTSINQKSLLRTFEQLAYQPVEAGRLKATRLPGRDKDFLAMGADGEPMFLLAVEKDAVVGPSVRLQHLSIDLSVNCNVVDDDGCRFSGLFSVIALTPAEVSLTEFFLGAGVCMIESMRPSPSIGDVQKAVSALIELFRLVSQVPRITIKGLWAELLTIKYSGAINDWVQAWHLGSRDTFDFSFNSVSVDVKSTEGSRRIHEIALRQLEPSSGSTVYIVSVPVRQSASGSSVLDLTKDIVGADKITRQLRDKVWSNVAELLGEQLVGADELLFDESEAVTGMRIVSGDKIPKPRVLDPRISDVRFSVDLTDLLEQVPLVSLAFIRRDGQ